MEESILFVDDNPIDLKSIKRATSDLGSRYSCTYCGSYEEAKQHLEKGNINYLVVDYYLGDGNGLELITEYQSIPTIFITGAEKVELAVSTMKAGARDFIVKDTQGKYLKDLPSLIRKMIEDNTEVERSSLDDEILIDILKNTKDLVQVVTTEGDFIYVNPSWLKLLSFSSQEIKNLNFFDILHIEDRNKWIGLIKDLKENSTPSLNIRVMTKHKEVRHLHGDIHIDDQNDRKTIRAIFRDVSEQKQKQLDILNILKK